MPFDPQAHRQRMLKHCLWLANHDPTYAKSAALGYEADSYGLLEGLHKKVTEIIDKKLKETNQPEQQHDL